jgi:hypothetical protein
MIKQTACALALALFAAAAPAVDWICSTSTQVRVAIAQGELPDGATASGAAVGTLTSRRPNRQRRLVDRGDLIQAYSGQPVLFGGTWLLAVMLPANHPDSRAAFADLGLSAEAAERLSSPNNIVDRGIRVVQTPDQVIQKVAINPPAVGYVGFFYGVHDVARCF